MKRTAAFSALCIVLMSLLVSTSGARIEGLGAEAVIVETSPDWTAEGDQANAQFGSRVSTAGDVNGDGFADVIVGAPFYDGGETDEGRAYVYYGSIVGSGLRPAWTAESDQAEARMGPVGTAGDVNGDGYADVIVGAPGYDGGETDEGRAYVYYGSARGLSALPNWSAESDQAHAEFGHAVGTAGDVNGDGFADVIVGAPRYRGRGRAYVYHGSDSGLSLTPHWTVEGDQAGALFGWSVGTAGDVNGDGYDDVIVSAMWYSNPERWEGRVYVYHGSALGLSSTPNWTVESNQSFAHFGFSAGTAGDVNGDGYDDVIIGAPSYYDWFDGRVFVYYGSATGLSTTPNWTARDDQADTDFGFSVGSAGDVNGDGFADVIIGAWGYDNGQTDEGRAYLYHGSTAGLKASPDRTVESDQADAHFGMWVGTAGHVNGDGFADVIVGAPLYDGGETDEGRAYAYYGRGTPSVTRQIAAGTDDTCIRMETEENRVDWQFVRLGKSAYTHLCGFRFTGVAIPRGARILDATLSFHPTGWSTGVPVNYTLYGEATGHAVGFAAGNLPAHLRPRTWAEVPWTLSTVPTTWFDTPNLAPLIQEIVDRSDWWAGNALSLLVVAAADNRYYVDAWAYDGRPALAARLQVHYESPPPLTNIWHGSITSDTVWRAAHSPYYVDGDLTIERGVTLTVEPGVEVRFLPYDRLASGVDPEKVELIVNGTLVADGEPQGEGITFTSAAITPTPGNWYGIRFTDSSTDWSSRGCILDHTVIRYASVGITTEAASPMLSHNVITEIGGDPGEEGESAYGIRILNGSRPFVIQNVIEHIQGGTGETAGGHGIGIAVTGSTPLIVGNRIAAMRGNVAVYGTYYHVMACGGWGVGIHVTDSPAFLIADNTIEDITGAVSSVDFVGACGFGVGIYLHGASPDIGGNRLTNIRGGNGASQEDDYGDPGSPGIGVLVINSSAPYIHDNVITGVRGGHGGTQSVYQAPPGGLSFGIEVANSSPVIAHNTISGVYGGRGGDGYYSARGGSGGMAVGIHGHAAAFPVFDNLIFDIIGGEGDDAEEGGGNGGDGKGIYAEENAVLQITNNTIVHAVGGRGGAYGGTDGLGIGVDASTWAVVTNNIIVGHTYGIRCSAPPCPAPSYNDLWSNAVNYVGVAAGPGDISADPRFIAGPEGYYYLRQVEAGQGENSPCVDAGSDTAARLGLAHRSTRTDGMPDTGRVDMGYHHRADLRYTAWLPWVVRNW